MYDILELNKKLVPELREIAKELDIRKVESFKKQDLIYKILDIQAIKEAEKKRKVAEKDSPKEEKGVKSFFVKKQSQDANKNNDQDNKSKRPRRERVDTVIKREKVETGKKKQPQRESGVQSRQEQIKAIIKGFNREKLAATEEKKEAVQQSETNKPTVKVIPKEEQNLKILINGRPHQNQTTILKDGDVIALFPPIGGG